MRHPPRQRGGSDEPAHRAAQVQCGSFYCGEWVDNSHTESLEPDLPPDSAANGEAEPTRRGVGIPIRCPIEPLLPNNARVRVRISNHPHQRRDFCNERNRIIGTLAKRRVIRLRKRIRRRIHTHSQSFWQQEPKTLPRTQKREGPKVLPLSMPAPTTKGERRPVPAPAAQGQARAIVFAITARNRSQSRISGRAIGPRRRFWRRSFPNQGALQLRLFPMPKRRFSAASRGGRSARGGASKQAVS